MNGEQNNTGTQIDVPFLVECLTNLVRINSVNPSLVPGAPGEAEIGRYIENTLKGLGLPVDVRELEPGRVNVVSRVKGTGGGRSLMLNAHMDTVGIEGMKHPFSAEIRDGKLYGRGAQDMKGSIAAIMAVMKAMASSGRNMKGDLIAAFVADEEYASIGTERLLEHVTADGAVVAEPTDLDICLTHKGFRLYEFETVGKAAHGGCPDEGIDANMFMGRVLGELDRLSRDLRSRKPHPVVGTPSLHVPLMKGGDQLFVYSSKSAISVERRTIPGETADQLIAEMEQILQRCRDADPRFRGSVSLLLGREPFEVRADARIVRALQDGGERVLGRTPNFTGHSWWEDSALCAAAGIETVIFGPTGAGLHTAEEWVEVDSVVALAQVLVAATKEYCH